ncbi:hypothetical protein [Halovivax cerinus]|uniref:Uncharacterized protein n=1 Tax=Halovivax cerinus TaxID=1487865 RepID=A0ABD5NJE4_9EURY|nr:hypothetical protein [Halovivax cerinus]
MKRRHVLAAAGLGATAATAGCLQRLDATTPADTQPRGSTPDGDTPPSDAARSTRVPSGGTVERAPGDDTSGIGGRRSPHAVFLTNPTNTGRTVALVIVQGGKTLLDEAFAVEPEGTVAVEIRRLAAYTVEATVEGSGETETATVERAQFDCNATSVQLELQADSSLSSSTLSTLMACGNVVTDRVASGERVEHTVGTIEQSDELDGHHTVSVENPTARPLTARLLLGDGERTLFDGLFSVEPDATADVHFDRNGSDRIEARVLETDASATVDLEEAGLGCTAARTTFELTEGGVLDTSTISTDLACHPNDA